MPDQAACLSRALAYYPERVQKTAPLIHCITNYVTAGDVANLLLAAGASPVMDRSSGQRQPQLPLPATGWCSIWEP